MKFSQQRFVSPLEGWILLCALLNAAGWLLSFCGELNAEGYLAVFLLSGGLLGWWWTRARPRVASGFRLRRFRRSFPLAFASVAILALAGGLLHSPSNYDAMAYRTPRVLHWLAEGHWHWIHTDFQRLNTRGCGIEWMTAPLILLTGSDRFLFLINAVSFLFLPGLSFGILNRLGVRPRVAWYWMWVLPTGYCYLLQAGSVANDLFGATLALAAVYYALRSASESSLMSGWLSILAAALMTSGKGFNLLLLLPWGVALFPALRMLFRRPLALIGIGSLALLVSLMPTAILNSHYSGDWKGIKAEPVNLGTGEPGLHLAVNGALLVLHSFNPTFSPLAGLWNKWIQQAIPPSLAQRLAAQFETSGAQFQIGEIQMEEIAGLGFGVSILLLPLVPGLFTLNFSILNKWRFWLLRPAVLVPAGAWLVIIYFLTQSGLACPGRYLAPSYGLLLAPLLCLPRATELIARAWWRALAMVGFVLAALLLVASPPRPLWPALTLLRAIHADATTSPWLQRIWTVYSVYGARSDGFEPVRAILPPNLKLLGLLTFDDPETSLWRPFGARRIAHIVSSDDAASVRKMGIEYVLLSEHVLQNNQNSTLQLWLARFHGEIIHSFDLTLRATRGPTRWHLVRLSDVSAP